MRQSRRKARKPPIGLTLGGFARLLREAFTEWWNDDAMRLAAALSFYTIFSLAPMLYIVLAIASSVVERSAAQAEIASWIGVWMGPEGAASVTAIAGAAPNEYSTATTALLAVGTMLFGGTVMFTELQDALNAIWKVHVQAATGLLVILRQRILSLLMLLGIGFLLLVSLAASTVLTALAGFWEVYLPGGSILLQSANFVISFAMVTLLFAAIYRILPQVDLAWSDVWMGAVTTALLFTVGKSFIGFYLGSSSLGSIYGAAGSFVVLLLWVYYSAQIFYFGAEMVRVYARSYGSQRRR